MTIVQYPLLVTVILALIAAFSKLVLVWIVLRKSEPDQRPKILRALGRLTNSQWKLGPLSRGGAQPAEEAAGTGRSGGPPASE